MQNHLNSLRIQTPQISMVANLSAKIITQADEIKSALIQQICSPVQWEQSMRLLIDKGVDFFIEVGPGKVLSNLLKRIAPKIKTQITGDLSSLQKALNLINS